MNMFKIAATATFVKRGMIFFFLFKCCDCRKPADLHNLAPGTRPPFLTFQGEVLTDVNKIEEYLEEMLAPPK